MMNRHVATVAKNRLSCFVLLFAVFAAPIKQNKTVVNAGEAFKSYTMDLSPPQQLRLEVVLTLSLLDLLLTCSQTSFQQPTIREQNARFWSRCKERHFVLKSNVDIRAQKRRPDLLLLTNQRRSLAGGLDVQIIWKKWRVCRSSLKSHKLLQTHQGRLDSYQTYLGFKTWMTVVVCTSVLSRQPVRETPWSSGRCCQATVNNP